MGDGYTHEFRPAERNAEKSSFLRPAVRVVWKKYGFSHIQHTVETTYVHRSVRTRPGKTIRIHAMSFEIKGYDPPL